MFNILLSITVSWQDVLSMCKGISLVMTVCTESAVLYMVPGV